MTRDNRRHFCTDNNSAVILFLSHKHADISTSTLKKRVQNTRSFIQCYFLLVCTHKAFPRNCVAWIQIYVYIESNRIQTYIPFLHLCSLHSFFSPFAIYLSQISFQRDFLSLFFLTTRHCPLSPHFFQFSTHNVPPHTKKRKKTPP